MAPDTPRPVPALRGAALKGAMLATLAAIGLGWMGWQRLRPVRVAVGIDHPLLYGAGIDPSDRNTAQLFLEDHPHSPIRLVDQFNSVEPTQAPEDIQAVIEGGVRFFVTTQASSHAVPSQHLFANGEPALAINVSATSTQLSGQDDQFLRVIPDLALEQRAIARQMRQLPGRRLLVIQDTGNLAYTKPALAEFLRELQQGEDWQVTVHPQHLRSFDPRRHQAVLAQPYDALYVLGGGFNPLIGNICQWFHQANPEATIVLTPWARSPTIAANAGPATSRILIASPYPARGDNPVLDAYLARFEERFGYEPYVMAIATRQALELLDQAFRQGHRSPSAVKRYLLGRREHPTSFGPIQFDASGDMQAQFHFIRKPTGQGPS